MSRIKRIIDPLWEEISASLRDEKLYVKMPLSTCEYIIFLLSKILTLSEVPADSLDHLRGLLEFLTKHMRKSIARDQRSMFYCVSAETAALDVGYLNIIEFLDPTGYTSIFRQTLEAGIAGDFSVDWLARVDGPKPKKKETL